MWFIRTRRRDPEAGLFILLDGKLQNFKNLSIQTSAQNDNPIHQLRETNDIKWIVIGGNIIHDATNSYFEQIRQPNGDIYLRLVDIFKDTKNRSRPEVSQQPINQIMAGNH